MAFVHFIELFRTGRSAYLQGFKHSIWVVSNCNFYYVYSLLAILFVVVLGMDGYKVNPASAAKKLYNGNGTLDLVMRRVSPGRRFCSGAGKLGVDKVVELSQIQVFFGWWDFWKGFDSWSFKISTQVSFTGFSSEKMMTMRMVIYTLAIWSSFACLGNWEQTKFWSDLAIRDPLACFNACIITLSCCDSFEFFFLICTNLFWIFFFSPSVVLSLLESTKSLPHDKCKKCFCIGILPFGSCVPFSFLSHFGTTRHLLHINVKTMMNTIGGFQVWQ